MIAPAVRPVSRAVERVAGSPTGRVVTLAGLAGFLVVCGVSAVTHRIGWQGADAKVYAAGARAFVDGAPVYEVFVEGFPFTYPPIAAVVLAPLAFLSATVGGYLMLVVGLIALVAGVYLVVRSVRGERRSGDIWVALAWTVPSLVLYPVWTSLLSGQVDTLLMALVLVDLLALPVASAAGSRFGRFRGVALGMAGAIKLTPLVFLLTFVVRRDWRALGTALATMVLVSGVGYALAPSDSTAYWGRYLWDSGRVGIQGAALNQSLAGVVARAIGPAGPVLTGSSRFVWLALAVLTVLVGWLAMRRIARRGSALELVAVNAIVALLISPISWMHHWVWCVPILAALLVRGTMLARVVALVGVVASVVAPHWVFGSFVHVEGFVSWGPVAQLGGSLMVWWALAAAGEFASDAATGGQPPDHRGAVDGQRAQGKGHA